MEIMLNNLFTDQETSSTEECWEYSGLNKQLLKKNGNKEHLHLKSERHNEERRLRKFGTHRTLKARGLEENSE